MQTATGLFHDRIVVVNDTTGETILDTVLPYSPAVEGFVPANGSVDRDYVFVLPDGPAGTGNLVITITTDVDNEVLEGFVGDLHENNNTSSGSASSSLNAYPDLIVDNISLDPASAGLGGEFTVNWQIRNVGQATTQGSFKELVQIVNTTSGQTIFEEQITYISLFYGEIAAGEFRDRDLIIALPDAASAIGQLEVIVTTDAQNEIFEHNATGDAESNNVSTGAAITLLAPDLTIAPQLSTLAANFGDTINVDYAVVNAGDGPTTQNIVDRVWLSTDSVLDANDTLLATVDAQALPLAAGAEYVRDDFLVTLPLDTELIEGNFYLLFVTDAAASQTEWLEDNNLGAAGPLALTFPDLPDLQIAGLSVVEAAPLSGEALTIGWQTRNAGNAVAAADFSERLIVVNTSTGATLLNSLLDYDFATAGPIGAGASVERQYAITLPDGPAGSGQYRIQVVTDSSRDIVEGPAGGIAENNNETEISVAVGLRPYPDLTVTQLSLDPSTVLTGEDITVRWSVVNLGSEAVDTDFVEQVRIVNQSTGATLLTTSLPYEVFQTGTIAVGQTRDRELIVTIPDGSGSVGTLEIMVTTDSGNTIFEHDPAINAENNNSISGTISTTLAPYPDLVVSEVVGPAQTIGDPARVTVSWTVTNDGSARQWRMDGTT